MSLLTTEHGRSSSKHAKTENRKVDEYIGRRVRMRRMAVGMSQEKLANYLGITFQQVQKYEKGTNRIGGSRMQQIAGALEVKPAFFFDGAPGAGSDISPLGRGESPAFIDDFITSTDGIRLARYFVRLSPDLQRDVSKLVEYMATAVK
jgi:transcriptional regulator with XRE-family HTH domain